MTRARGARDPAAISAASSNLAWTASRSARSAAAVSRRRHQKPQRSMMTASESTEHTSRGIITGPPLASIPITAVRWCTSRPSHLRWSAASPGVVARCMSHDGLGGWLDEQVLLGQDELVRRGDVEPIFHALMHDDDLAAPIEEIGALDAEGRGGRAALRLVAFLRSHFRSPWAPTTLCASSTSAATMR